MRIKIRSNHHNLFGLFGVITLAAVLFLAGGCGGAITGDWHMIKAIPSKEMFAIDDAHFAQDRTYHALITIEGKTMREVGKYKFDGLRLTMYPNAGGWRRYNTLLKGSTFEIHSSTRKLILKRGKKSTDE